jgi:hypothetical protein
MTTYQAIKKLMIFFGIFLWSITCGAVDSTVVNPIVTAPPEHDSYLFFQTTGSLTNGCPTSSSYQTLPVFLKAPLPSGKFICPPGYAGSIMAIPLHSYVHWEIVMNTATPPVVSNPGVVNVSIRCTSDDGSKSAYIDFDVQFICTK